MSARLLDSAAAARVAPIEFPEIGAMEPRFETVDEIVFEPDPANGGEFSAHETTPATHFTETPEHGAVADANAVETIERVAREAAELEAKAEIESQVSHRLAEIRENFAETLQELSMLRERFSEEVEKDVVELALEIAKRVVGREVAFDREIALTLVKVSLKKINSRTPLAQVHLHPEDFRYIEARREQIDFRGSLEFTEDTSVSIGGCLIHTETGEVDSRIESQFDEVAHGLLGR